MNMLIHVGSMRRVSEGSTLISQALENVVSLLHDFISDVDSVGFALFDHQYYEIFPLTVKNSNMFDQIMKSPAPKRGDIYMLTHVHIYTYAHTYTCMLTQVYNKCLYIYTPHVSTYSIHRYISIHTQTRTRSNYPYTHKASGLHLCRLTALFDTGRLLLKLSHTAHLAVALRDVDQGGFLRVCLCNARTVTYYKRGLVS